MRELEKKREQMQQLQKEPAENRRRWNGFAVSVCGSGHIRRGVPCQDASSVLLLPRPAVIVCDGRGSAAHSELGAEGAVRAFRTQLAILEPFLIRALDEPDSEEELWLTLCRIFYRTLVQVKLELAEEKRCAEKEFDFTVVFAVAGLSRIGCFQVGDGALVLRQNGICRTVFPPDKGDFANQTNFLRPGGEHSLRFHTALFPARENSGIAATSDGPEYQMFRLSDMTPGPIFSTMFQDLRVGILQKQDIRNYLTRRIWECDVRGGDDRSIALLVPESQKENSLEKRIEEKSPIASSEKENECSPAHTAESLQQPEKEFPSDSSEKEKKNSPFASSGETVQTIACCGKGNPGKEEFPETADPAGDESGIQSSPEKKRSIQQVLQHKKRNKRKTTRKGLSSHQKMEQRELADNSPNNESGFRRNIE